MAVLETARGGILLRGIGYAVNDVSVVTNVSADHLGLQGIDTVDELAEVKGTVVAITRRDGWAVLNVDDPRVWEMRRRTRANLYAFSLQPRSGAVEAVLDSGGRAAVVDREWIVLRGAGRKPRRLVEAASLPVTFGGLSRYNVANALAAAAACDALGLSTRQIASGLALLPARRGGQPGSAESLRARRCPRRRGLRPQRGGAHRPDGGGPVPGGERTPCASRTERRGIGPTRSSIGWASSRPAPTTSSSPRSATTFAAETSER